MRKTVIMAKLKNSFEDSATFKKNNQTLLYSLLLQVLVILFGKVPYIIILNQKLHKQLKLVNDSQIISS